MMNFLRQYFNALIYKKYNRSKSELYIDLALSSLPYNLRRYD